MLNHSVFIQISKFSFEIMQQIFWRCYDILSIITYYFRHEETRHEAAISSLYNSRIIRLGSIFDQMKGIVIGSKLSETNLTDPRQNYKQIGRKPTKIPWWHVYIVTFESIKPILQSNVLNILRRLYCNCIIDWYSVIMEHATFLSNLMN